VLVPILLDLQQISSSNDEELAEILRDRSHVRPQARAAFNVWIDTSIDRDLVAVQSQSISGRARGRGQRNRAYNY